MGGLVGGGPGACRVLTDGASRRPAAGVGLPPLALLSPPPPPRTERTASLWFGTRSRPCRSPAPSSTAACFARLPLPTPAAPPPPPGANTPRGAPCGRRNWRQAGRCSSWLVATRTCTSERSQANAGVAGGAAGCKVCRVRCGARGSGRHRQRTCALASGGSLRWRAERQVFGGVLMCPLHPSPCARASRWRWWWARWQRGASSQPIVASAGSLPWRAPLLTTSPAGSSEPGGGGVWVGGGGQHPAWQH